MKDSSGFTLMEILVVLGIIGMATLIAAAVIPTGSRDEASYQATLEIMGRLRQALLGVPPAHLAGERRYMGYIADMGELPDLLGDGKQPAGLWTDKVADVYGAKSNLPAWHYTGDETDTTNDARLWIGWHGPYIEASAGVLRDGWGNPLIFERFDISADSGAEVANANGRNLRIKSLGSDGVLQKSGDGDTGYRADIELVIRVKDYLGSVAGYAGSEIDSIDINFPSRGKLKTMSLAKETDGYFFSGTGTDDRPLLPMGTRSLCLTTAGKSVKVIVLSLEPTANFTGTVR
jgi:prepilin-type N-terminal cleavage/methylation domain-containing protein